MNGPPPRELTHHATATLMSRGSPELYRILRRRLLARSLGGDAQPLDALRAPIGCAHGWVHFTTAPDTDPMVESDHTQGCVAVCRCCGSRDVRIVQKQTRSADEAMTVFAACRACGARWKS